MQGKIYLLQDDGTLQSLTEHPYDSEDLLQRLLGKYPDLLAGDQMDDQAPRRWLLISREVGIAAEPDGAELFSLDHLFLDQDAVPTLVEVKRSTDVRIRREVVGQMLDYAAHAVAHWSADRLRARFESGCAAQGQDPVQMVAEVMGSDPADVAAVDAFWAQVKTNLQAGKIRLVFVADAIPSELRRVVEFLNRYMDPVEVLAVEIHQYVGPGLKTLVPRVLGQTEEARGRKAVARGAQRQWDEASLLAELETRRGHEEATAASAIIEWAKLSMPSFYWGKGERSGSCTPGLDHKGIWHLAFVVWTYGKIEMQFQHMQPRPPFDDDGKRAEMLRRLNRIPGIALPEDSINRRPSFPLSALTDDTALKDFLAVLDWFVQEVKAS